MGHVQYNFTPNLKKTFNRGFTHYFLNGRQPDIASFDTPKAIGEFVGKVKEIRGNISFNVATVASFKMAMDCVLSMMTVSWKAFV